MKRIFVVLVSFAFSLMLFGCDDVSDKPESDVKDIGEYDMSYYMKPYWENDYVINEPAMVQKDSLGKVKPIQLLYDIEEVVSVRNHRLNTLYKVDEDYKVVDHKLVIIEDGAIYSDIALDYDEYYFEEFINNVNYPLENGKATLKTEADYGKGGMTDYQVVVTYKHKADEQRMMIPFEQNQASKLTNSIKKITNKEEAHIVLVGDSISAGWSASGFLYSNISPYSPNYFGLVEEYLSDRFDNQRMIFDNYAISGETTKMLLRESVQSSVKASQPDLIIIAYGGNDGTVGGNISPQLFRDNVQTFITKIRESFPQCEFLILTSAIVNSEITGMFKNQSNYTSSIKEIANKDDKVAVVDIYRAINEVLMRKKYVDITANNINHPNDFIHRLYAQMIIKTLIDDYK